MTAKPIFIGGTASHVGKSWVATALCRYLYQKGYRVAPFKAQNMSNNSMVCTDGGEIGRAQAAQAEACGLAPHSDMNPILLKPTGRLGSQVILSGKPWGNPSTAEYYTHFRFLLDHVLECYSRLAEKYDYIVIEGAGSLTELNLKHRDVVNLGLASRVGAPAILVADVDRGGIFASVVGTFHLLDAKESDLVRTFLVNRFRGDINLFKDGVRILQEKTGHPCLGVFPFKENIYIDAEDSVSLDQRAQSTSSIAIVRLPHISNFTDFRLIPDACYLSNPSNEHFDVIFLPGTKNTIDDTLWLRKTGMDAWLLEEIARGARLIGVCGGFQMLGEEIIDPHHVESSVYSVRGLGLIPARTMLAEEKTTRRVSARTPSGIRFDAYEIHMGATTIQDAVNPFAILEDGTTDGVRLGQIIGTYLHGAFENRAVLEELTGKRIDGRTVSKEIHYDRLADWFASYVNEDVLAAEYL